MAEYWHNASVQICQLLCKWIGTLHKDDDKSCPFCAHIVIVHQL